MPVSLHQLSLLHFRYTCPPPIALTTKYTVLYGCNDLLFYSRSIHHLPSDSLNGLPTQNKSWSTNISKSSNSEMDHWLENIDLKSSTWGPPWGVVVPLEHYHELFHLNHYVSGKSILLIFFPYVYSLRCNPISIKL